MITLRSFIKPSKIGRIKINLERGIPPKEEPVSKDAIPVKVEYLEGEDGNYCFHVTPLNVRKYNQE